VTSPAALTALIEALTAERDTRAGRLGWPGGDARAVLYHWLDEMRAAPDGAWLCRAKPRAKGARSTRVGTLFHPAAPGHDAMNGRRRRSWLIGHCRQACNIVVSQAA
jgi:hypothetical protein